MTVDLECATYVRQDQKALLFGTYELNHEQRAMDGAPWDYGMELFLEQTDRIENEPIFGLERYPALQTTGVKTWLNDAFTLSPDGNPLVGLVNDVNGYWCACSVMAGSCTKASRFWTSRASLGLRSQGLRRRPD